MDHEYQLMKSMKLLAEDEKRRKRVTPLLQEELKSFLRNASLYRKKDAELVADLAAFYPQSILLYCPSCRADRPFHDSIPMQYKKFPTDEKAVYPRSGIYSYHYACTGCSGKFYCWILVEFENGSIEKVGQHPSVADLTGDELRKYRKVLGARFVEFNRAVGLYAHGVGIGSFVYLRRIFEGLVEEAYGMAKQDPNWNDNSYQKARMDERIVLLSNHLPQTLIDNSGMYTILSKGIHALSEDECLLHFNALKLCVELIMDEKIEKNERQEKMKRVAGEISRIKGGLT